jgi:hypothetical protein
VGYGAWQNNNSASVVKSDLKGVKASMESARNFSGSAGYPLAIPSTFSASQNVTLTYKYGTSTTFCIEGVNSKNPSTTFYISNAKDATSGTCP